jgi:hypothetical protein
VDLALRGQLVLKPGSDPRCPLRLADLLVQLSDLAFETLLQAFRPRSSRLASARRSRTNARMISMLA